MHTYVYNRIVYRDLCPCIRFISSFCKSIETITENYYKKLPAENYFKELVSNSFARNSTWKRSLKVRAFSSHSKTIADMRLLATTQDPPPTDDL